MVLILASNKKERRGKKTAAIYSRLLQILTYHFVTSSRNSKAFLVITIKIPKWHFSKAIIKLCYYKMFKPKRGTIFSKKTVNNLWIDLNSFDKYTFV
jgi:hypothetical protein